jgi:hypothetical protein
MGAPLVFPGQDFDPSDVGAPGWANPGEGGFGDRRWGEIYTGISPSMDQLTPELPGAMPEMPRYDAGIPSAYQLMADAAAAGQEINLYDIP